MFERMKVERKQHRRAVRLAALGREEMDFDKHCYPRDRIWNWKGRGEEEEEEEEDNENGSDSDGQFELTRRPTARSSRGAGSRTAGRCKWRGRGRGRGFGKGSKPGAAGPSTAVTLDDGYAAMSRKNNEVASFLDGGTSDTESSDSDDRPMTGVMGRSQTDSESSYGLEGD